MVRLRQRDLLRLLECLGEVYAHLDLHSFAPRALRVCRKAVASDDALGNEVNRLMAGSRIRLARTCRGRRRGKASVFAGILC